MSDWNQVTRCWILLSLVSKPRLHAALLQRMGGLVSDAHLYTLEISVVVHTAVHARMVFGCMVSGLLALGAGQHENLSPMRGTRDVYFMGGFHKNTSDRSRFRPTACECQRLRGAKFTATRIRSLVQCKTGAKCSACKIRN